MVPRGSHDVHGAAPGEECAAPLVVIVAYNADDHLLACLDHLGSRNVIIIDNAANARTSRIAASCGVRYVAAPTNIGFARGVNLGLRHAWDGTSDVLLLNPDARITALDIANLQQAMHATDESLAAVGPALVGVDGKSQQADWPMPSPASVWLDAFGLSTLWRGRRFVVGAVLLLNGNALAEMGGLDERYFLYAEEADWQMRALRRGWSVAVVPNVTAMHVGAASSSDDSLRLRLFHESGRIFAYRWYGPVGGAIMRLGSIVAALRRTVTGDSTARRTSRRLLRVLARRSARTGEGQHGP